jgi:hypothetical protein
MGTDPSVETAVAANNDDLFGESPYGNSTETAVATEPEQETGEEIPSGEEVADGSEAEQTETAEVEQQEEADDDLEVVLPKEQAKQYSKALMAHYAKRFGWTPEDLDSNRSYQYAVKKAIDTDIYTKNLQDRLAAVEKSATEAPKPAEVKKDEPSQPPNIDEHLKQTLAKVDSFNDQKVLEKFADQFNSETTAAGQFRVLSAGALNLMQTALPQMLPALIKDALEQVAPGLIADHGTYRTQQQLLSAYEEVKAGRTDLPDNFVDLEKAALAKEPLLAKLSADVTPKERFEAYARAVAGQKQDPAVIEKTAAKIADRKIEQKQMAEKGKGLGAGQTKGTMAERKTGNDDIFGPVGETMSQRWTGRKQ